MEPKKESDIVTAKQYLEQAYRLNQFIQSSQQELADLRVMSECISGIDYSKEKVQSSHSNDAGFAKIVEKIIELERAIKRDIEKMLSLKLEIRTAIDAVQNSDERLLLKYRYLNFMKWEEICVKMQISIRTAHRIHATAINNIKIS